jgi:hemerythrin
MERQMDLINWTSIWRSVAKIDEQHRQLFKAANALAEAMWDGKGESKENNRFRRLYLSFQDEEE